MRCNEVITGDRVNDLQKALSARAEHQLRHISVVDNDNNIVGIIAQADLAMRVDEPEKTGGTVKEISQANRK
jgi:CBS-domain-containing membrane protein